MVIFNRTGRDSLSILVGDGPDILYHMGGRGGGGNAGSAPWTGGVTGGAGAFTPRPPQAGLSVCLSVRPPPERKPHLPAPSSRPPLSSSPRLSAALRSVPVATLGVGASCVTTKCRLSVLDGGMAPRFDR